jgi:hypothetical protein
MTSPTLFWRVTFYPDGRVNRVRPIKGPGHSRWVVVQAATEEEARRKGYNLYCARKKRERGAVLKSQGRCACGRALDGALVERGRFKGEPHTKCAVCRTRRTESWAPKHAERRANGTVGQGIAERDEGARIALNLERQRDRKGEIRLETLVEVRQQWIAARNVALFGQWLQGEIAALTKNGAAA